MYRATQRYLRRHVARRSEHWVQQFIASSDPIQIAELMRVHRDALIAFGEMQWARTMEAGVARRRWPFRVDVTDDGAPLWGQLNLRGIAAQYEHLQLSRSELQWLEYHGSGAVMTALWRRSMNHAIESARSGIADWSVNKVQSPFAENWSAHMGAGGLHFVNLVEDSFVDWVLPVPDKAARKAQAQAQAGQARLAALATCKGACLSWNQRDGWHVAESVVPAIEVVQRHRLLGFMGEKPEFWLFEANGGFVARLQTMKLQTWAPTPKEAIHALRACLRQHRISYGATVTFPKSAPSVPFVVPVRTDRQSEELYRYLVHATKCRLGFWGSSTFLGMAARQFLYGLEGQLAWYFR